MFEGFTRWVVGVVVAIIIGCVYAIKVWDDLASEKNKNGAELDKQKGRLYRNAIYSGFGSGLLCLFVCEGCYTYFHLDFGLSLLIGATCGFLGVDTFKGIALRFLENKLNAHPNNNSKNNDCAHSSKGGENE